MNPTFYIKYNDNFTTIMYQKKNEWLKKHKHYGKRIFTNKANIIAQELQHSATM